MQGLRAHADDPAFQARWAEVKGIAKAKAMARIQELTGEALPAHAMLDIQVGKLCRPCLVLLFAVVADASLQLLITYLQLGSASPATGKPCSWCYTAVQYREKSRK